MLFIPSRWIAVPHLLHHFDQNDDRRGEDEGSSDAGISHCRRALQTLRQYKIITNMQSNDIKSDLITNISKSQLKDNLIKLYRQGFMPRPVFHPGQCQYLVSPASLHSAVFCWATAQRKLPWLGDSACKPRREETKSGHFQEHLISVLILAKEEMEER